ncbi:MAG: 30S ribosomal protein S5 [Bacteriovoracaceae bacterium]
MVDEKEVKNNDAKEAAPEGKKPAKTRRPSPKKKRPESLNPDLEERVVAVNRVAKVVKGGRRFSFSALIIVGDKKGHVGFGLGKAKEVPEAIRKATQAAEKNMINVPIDGGTIPHQVLGEFDAGKILFKPAADGTGIKAAGACRSILELAGVHNVLTKSLRGNNPHNVVKATFQALKQLRSPEQIAKVRGIEVKQVRLK